MNEAIAEPDPSLFARAPRLRQRALRSMPGKIHAGFGLLALSAAVAAVTGCGHHRTARQAPPPVTAPPVEPAPQPQTAESNLPPPPPPAYTRSTRIPPTPVPPGGVSEEDLDFILKHRPIFSEEGLATWYTAPYKGRRSANGQVFHDDELTAAHLTLPMGSLIVVTNLKTRQASAMRVTDRGPFAEGRILDLSIASAKATGIYRAGVAQVRMDVYQTPKPMETGGRWCVQIGAFHSEHQALKLKEQLLRRYPSANVIEFPGEDSYWVRIRPEGDDREMAESIARRLRPEEGEAFLTRLD
jgi:rare lipoprotein A